MGELEGISGLLSISGAVVNQKNSRETGEVMGGYGLPVSEARVISDPACLQSKMGMGVTLANGSPRVRYWGHRLLGHRPQGSTDASGPSFASRGKWRSFVAEGVVPSIYLGCSKSLNACYEGKYLRGYPLRPKTSDKTVDVIFLPIGFLVLQLVCSLPSYRPQIRKLDCWPKITVLIPAHNEAQVIAEP